MPSPLRAEMRRKLDVLRRGHEEFLKLLNELDSLVEDGYDENEERERQKKAAESLLCGRSQRLRYRSVH